MADRGERTGAGDEERMGRRVHEGLDGGVSRRSSMKGKPRPDEAQDTDRDAGHGGEFGATDDGSREGGSGGYGASSGFADETRGADEENDTLDRHAGGAELEPGATEARTRPGDVGRQAESGMETRPEEGTGSER